MKNSLSNKPEIIGLANYHQVSTRGNCVENLRNFALNKVEQFLAIHPIKADSIDVFTKVVCDKLSVKVEFIDMDDDIYRISKEYRNFNTALASILADEFVRGDTEGITLRASNYVEGLRKFLAIIDRRGERRSRAYFTTWHEIVHLLLPTRDQEVETVRRTPNQEAKKKDPIESVIDHVAGYLAIYEPIFKPVLLAKVKELGFSFEAIEQARDLCLPEASLLATLIRSINFFSFPILLLQLDLKLTKGEEKLANSPQLGFDFFEHPVEPKLRISRLIRNENAKAGYFNIQENMRIPKNSALSMTYYNEKDATYQAEENQGLWETSKNGALSELSIRVQAAKRGQYVYGLITLR